MSNDKNFATIYIVRHGETDWNVKGIMQGHQGTDLNEKGRQQARQLAEQFSGIKIDAIFSSDLTRALQTAEIMALEEQLAVTTTRLLRERNAGKFEGQPYQAMNHLMHLLQKVEGLSAEEKNQLAEPGMESSEEMVSRFLTFIREIAAAYAGKTVLAVSHGGMIRLLLAHLGYGEYLPAGKFANGGHLKLRSDGVEIFLDEVNGVETPQ